MVAPIRDCLAEAANNEKILTGAVIYKRYRIFVRMFKRKKIDRGSLSFGKFSQIISEFLARLNLTGD